VDRYAFAVHAAEVFGLDSSLIRGIPTSSLGQTAPRPLRGGLNIAKASSQLSFELRGYRVGLQNMYQTAGSI
jgi:dTDP-4-dehydrorhamnose reductase